MLTKLYITKDDNTYIVIIFRLKIKQEMKKHEMLVCLRSKLYTAREAVFSTTGAETVVVARVALAAVVAVVTATVVVAVAVAGAMRI